MSGAWRTISQIVDYHSGAWRIVANFSSSMSVALSATALSPNGRNPLTSSSVTATPSGGLAPYAYAWSIVSEDRPGTNVINSPTLATTTVTATGPEGTVACVIQCDVTDSLGVAATSDPVTISFAIK